MKFWFWNFKFFFGAVRCAGSGAWIPVTNSWFDNDLFLYWCFLKQNISYQFLFVEILEYSNLKHSSDRTVFDFLAAPFLLQKWQTELLMISCSESTNENVSTLLALSHCTCHRLGCWKILLIKFQKNLI